MAGPMSFDKGFSSSTSQWSLLCLLHLQKNLRRIYRRILKKGKGGIGSGKLRELFFEHREEGILLRVTTRGMSA